ncbi:MAG: hypothetical protein P0111_09760 [Nitrospira sp.]|nr:hypothetical protein [Nitrospira sp.]
MRIDDDLLIANTGIEHERSILEEFRTAGEDMVEIATRDLDQGLGETRPAVAAKAPVIYQAALEEGAFSGFADFLVLDSNGAYQVWDTKLARTPKPYYAIQPSRHHHHGAVGRRVRRHGPEARSGVAGETRGAGQTPAADERRPPG